MHGEGRVRFVDGTYEEGEWKALENEVGKWVGSYLELMG